MHAGGVRLFCAFCAMFALLGLTACGGGNAEPSPTPGTGQKTEVTVRDDGVLMNGGTSTGIRIYGYEKEACAGLTAFEAFCKYYPEYVGRESGWRQSVKSGALKTEYAYDAVTGGEAAGAEIKRGAAETVGGVLRTSGAAMELEKPVIASIRANGFFRISVSGALLPGGNRNNGGQFLNNGYDLESGRIYFGTNYDNRFLFVGVNLLGTYFNYGWRVEQETLAAEHDYEFAFDGEEFTLSVDGEMARGLEYVNVSQSDETAVLDSGAASRELLTKMKSVTGQPYLAFTSLGAATHPATVALRELQAVTSALFGYEELDAHPLAGETAYFLGSSVTRGHGGDTDGTSFADQIKSITGCGIEKQAVSGTTLAVRPNTGDSYVERFENFTFRTQPAAVFIQLSTNDFSQGIPLGESGDGTDTVTGAIEALINRAQQRAPDAEIVIYTCPLSTALPYYRAYGAYVDTVKRLAEQNGGVSVLDLYHWEGVMIPSRYLQGDGLHPTSDGYKSVFTPAAIELLTALVYER